MVLRCSLLCALLDMSGAASVPLPNAVPALVHSGTTDLSLQPREDTRLDSAVHTTAGTAPTYVFGPDGTAAKYEEYLNAGLAASPEACNQPGFPDVYLQNCLLRHSTSKRTELDASLSVCDWVPEDVSTTVQWLGPRTVPDWQSDEVVHRTEASFERCLLKNHGPLGHFEAIRVGPVTTHGGKDWTNFSVSYFTLKAMEDVDGGVFAATEAYAGAMAVDGTLLSYPPIHQHHYHVKEVDGYPAWGFGALTGTGRYEIPPASHAVITHGDDTCISSSGDVGCTIRRMVPGYATMLKAPLYIGADMNDVRANNSSPLSFYMILTLRGLPYDGTVRPFTELRPQINPYDAQFGYVDTYLVKSDRLSAFWRESTWLVNATVISSYGHTHPDWADDYMLYTGATGTQLQLDDLGFTRNITYLTHDAIEAAKQQLAIRAKQAGALLVCRYTRSANLLEKYDDTAELNDSFYRLAAACVPFRMSAGEPFVHIVFGSPESDVAAASIGADVAHPNERLSGMHTWFRIYISAEDIGVISANCDVCFDESSLSTATPYPSDLLR